MYLVSLLLGSLNCASAANRPTARRGKPVPACGRTRQVTVARTQVLLAALLDAAKPAFAEEWALWVCFMGIAMEYLVGVTS